MDRRASGILLPVFALPGDYGTGTLGAAARQWIDFLADAGQRYWQILPLVPPGGGNSPYMSPSSFAGNPLLLDLDALAADGLLAPADLISARCADADRVDYDALRASRHALLHDAWSRARACCRTALTQFWQEEADWLPDYALFMAVQADLGGLPLADWPEPLRLRAPDALAAARLRLEDEIGYHAFLQFLFFRQWEGLKRYANAKGISIIGDLPIYVSPDSAEVWAHPALFLLDEAGRPAEVAGVPPDALAADGQHWGNPLYDWPTHQKTSFAWWRRRGAQMARLYDVVRIDHFRAFHTYWCIPAGAAGARDGHWAPGPGMPLLDALRAVPGLALIAEDLGQLDAAALDFIAQSGLPGMKVLVYAFDPAGESAYLPHNCPRDAVIYTGTHDTPTAIEWLFTDAGAQERDYAAAYLRLRADEGFNWGIIAGAWASPCRLAIAPMQDVLGLGADARMNTPGTVGAQNWSWRVRAAALNPAVSARLAALTRTYHR